MATIAVGAVSPRSSRGKALVFGFIFTMMAYVLVHNESFLVNRADPVWQHYKMFHWWLLPHGLAAACALLLGPMQFSERLRKRYTKFHRVIGRFYVGGVIIGAPLGSYVQFMEGPLTIDVATVVDATLWVSCTVIALAFAMNGMIKEHRQWMTRSYAIAIAFLEIRFISGIFRLDSKGDEVTGVVIWSCIACTVFLADVVIQIQEYRGRLRQKRIAAASA